MGYEAVGVGKKNISGRRGWVDGITSRAERLRDGRASDVLELEVGVWVSVEATLLEPKGVR